MCDAPTLLTFHVNDAGCERLDTYLVSQLPDFSRARIQGLIRSQHVRLNDVCVTKCSAHVDPLATLTLEIPPPVPALPQPEDLPLEILFEDEDLIVLNKPAGVVVHPAPGHLTGTLVNALLAHNPHLSGIGGVARPGIVHRLDQDTSGVLVVAQSQLAMDHLTRDFASHAHIRKTYLALVHGTPLPAEGRLVSLIGRSPYDRKKMAVVERTGKEAITQYHVLPHRVKKDYPLSFVSCLIETGRTHQIRVHLASLCGCPIVGDALYGRSGWDRTLTPRPPRQLLHAFRLELSHPRTRKPLTFEAPLPEAFKPYLIAPEDPL